MSAVRSRRVMERIGMTRDPEGDFDHPLVEPGSSLRRHVLYRIQRPQRQPGLPNNGIVGERHQLDSSQRE